MAASPVTIRMTAAAKPPTVASSAHGILGIGGIAFKGNTVMLKIVPVQSGMPCWPKIAALFGKTHVASLITLITLSAAWFARIVGSVSSPGRNSTLGL